MSILRILALDHSNSSDAKYHQSYQCLIDGKERFLCDYYARANIVQETEIIDLKDAHNSLHIKQTKKSHRPLIEIANAEHSEVWHFEHDQLTNTSGEIIARLASPDAEEKSLKDKTNNNGRYVIKNSKNSILLASIYHPPQPQSNALMKVMQTLTHPLNNQEHEVYRVKVNRWGGNIALVLAMALVKYHEFH